MHPRNGIEQERSWEKTARVQAGVLGQWGLKKKTRRSDGKKGAGAG